MVRASDTSKDAQSTGRAPVGPKPGPGTEPKDAAAKKRKVKHLRHPFLTELFRSIGSTLTRFLAIMSIVGLGVGFYAGLNMTGRDMRIGADIYDDGTCLFDLRVISTLGLSDEQVDEIAAVDGVDQVSGEYATDVMLLIGGDRYVTHVMSCDMDAAREATVDEAGAVVESADDGYINRLVLVDGSWPSSVDECVLPADVVLNSPVEVGDSVEVLYGTGDIDDVMTRRTFTVSGLVYSSAYPSDVMLGYSTLGSGTVQEYMYVCDEAFSDELPYTEVYVTVEGARDYPCYSDGYQACVDEVAARIEGMGLGAMRLAELKGSAQSELDDAQDEYDEGEAQASSELENARGELSDAYGELSDAKSQLEDAQDELSDAKAQLEDAKSQLEDAGSAIESGRREYDDGVRRFEEARDQARQKLSDARAELEAGARKIESAEAQLGMTQADINAAYSEFAAGEAQWQVLRAELLSARSDISAIRAFVSDLSYYLALDRVPTVDDVAIIRSKAWSAMSAAERLYNSDLSSILTDEQAAQMEQVVADISDELTDVDFSQPPDEVFAQLRTLAPSSLSKVESYAGSLISQIDEGIAEGDATVADYRDLLSQAQSARTKIDAAKQELASGWETYFESASEAESQLDSARRTLDEAAAELADADRQYQEGLGEYQDGLEQYQEGLGEYQDGLEQYQEGLGQYQDGYKTYIESRDEVENTFADAAAQIQAAQADIDSLEEPTVYVLDRTKNAGLVSYMDDTYRMDSIASVFPVLFFLVAALVSLTTMTRMVEDERADIGTHKALGFSTARITAKYVAYAGLAGLTGSAIGIFLLSQLLPWVVQVAYRIMYSVPVLPFLQPIDLGVSALSTAIGLGVTFVAIFAAATATLREVPATLMLPRAPKAGQRILLERVGFVWKNLSFSWKVTFRNLFRYKQRLVMTVVGVAGCTALLLTGFGLHNAIWDIIDCQTDGANPVSRFNVTLGLDAGVDESGTDEVERILSEVGGATDFEYADLENLEVASTDIDDTSTLQIHIVTDTAEFEKMYDLRERVSKEPIEFTQDSVVMTEKMARRLNVGVGDTVRVFERDELGNPTGDGHEFTLTGVCENYVYHYLFVGANAWKEATGEVCAVDSIFTDVDPSEETHSALVNALADNEAVASIEFVEETIDSYRTSLKAVNMIVVVLVVAAAALDFIVLYNLINIQLIERMREIASLKVLGFNRREVANYLFRETIILVVVGSLVGLALGVVMEGFVVVTAEVDAVMFGRDIHFPSFVYAFGLSVLFSLLVMAFVLPKLRKIDMVESLKSVD